MFTHKRSSTQRWIIFSLLPLIANLWQVAHADSANSPTIQQTIESKLTNKPEYYPQCRQTPLRVTEEDYQEDYVSLRGLTGVYINFDDVFKGAASRDVALDKNLINIVTKMLNAHGLRLLSKEEMQQTPGQPEMSIYPNYPGHLGPYNDGDERITYREDCCTVGVWTAFKQGASTLRDPLTHHKFSTWGKGHNTNNCSDIGGWLSEVVQETVEEFLEDKAKADTAFVEKKKQAQKAGKKLVEARKQPSPAESGSMECNTSLMMYIEMFKTNQTNIMPSKYFVLNKLANAMKSCPSYHYIIETHADPRASHAYNEQLSEKRANSIRRYLINKGVDKDAFEMMPFGETRPVTAGISDEDFAANRRVVVTPIKIQP